MAYISFQPSDHFSPKLYTGTGSSLGVTGVGFQPDFVWIKNTEATVFHVLTDVPRGATKYLSSNLTAVPVTNAESLKSFDSDGFTVGTMNEVNTNTEDYVSWNWKGGTTSGITTDGSTTITPSAYSFSATSGFSALAYTGTGSNAMLAHGLGVAPEMVIIKNLSAGNDWKVYSKYMKATDPEDWHMGLNKNSVAVDEATVWNDTQPDTVNVSLGTSTHVNDSTKLYIAYCFASIKGFSKMGAYVGNGNASGTFIYTGFRPAFFLLKSATAVENWYVMDSKRDGYNEKNDFLNPDENTAEIVKTNCLVSNGVKLRTADGSTNGSGQTFIYAAFAEFPTVSSNDIPGTAR